MGPTDVLHLLLQINIQFCHSIQATPHAYDSLSGKVTLSLLIFFINACISFFLSTCMHKYTYYFELASESFKQYTE